MTEQRSLQDWAVSSWLNVEDGFGVDRLAGRVVLAAAFQMLCPGCVEKTIPQLREAAALFSPERVAVVGLHTVFEHHEAMTPVALRAFAHEYRLTFPIGIDTPDPDGQPIPLTMARFAMQGTPTLMLFDQRGQLRHQNFGHLNDLHLGAAVTELVLTAG